MQPTLNGLSNVIHNTCEKKGFHEPVDPGILNNALRLLLIVSEVGEAIDHLRKGEIDEHNEEVADILIRTLHYGRCNDINLDKEVRAKMEKNEGRPYKHGKLF